MYGNLVLAVRLEARYTQSERAKKKYSNLFKNLTRKEWWSNWRN